jgi:hypothetical protein
MRGQPAFYVSVRHPKLGIPPVEGHHQSEEGTTAECGMRVHICSSATSMYLKQNWKMSLKSPDSTLLVFALV